MPNQYRFGDVQRRSRGKHKVYSLNALTPRLETDAEGNLIPYRTPRFKVNASERINLLRPYVSVRMMEQVKASCTTGNLPASVPGADPATTGSPLPDH